MDKTAKLGTRYNHLHNIDMNQTYLKGSFYGILNIVFENHD